MNIKNILIALVGLFISLIAYPSYPVAKSSSISVAPTTQTFALPQPALLAATTIQTNTTELETGVAPISPKNADQVKQLAQVGRGTVETIAWSPNGRVMAVAGTLGVYLYEADTLQELRLLPTDRPVKLLSFSPAGDQLISGDVDGQVQVWATDSGQLLYRVPGTNSGLTRIAFSPDGQTAMAHWEGAPVQIWKAQTGQLLHTYQSALFAVDFLSLDFQTALAANFPPSAPQLFEVSSGRLLYTFPEGSITQAAFSPNGQILAITVTSAGAEEVIYLYGVATGQFRQFPSAQQYSNVLAFNPDGRWLASGGGDTIKLWNVTNGQLHHTLAGHGESLAFSPDSRSLAVSGADNSIKLWDVTTGQPIRTFTGQLHQVTINQVAFDPTGRRLLSVSFDKVQLWNVDTGQSIRSFDKYWPDHPLTPQIVLGPPGQLVTFDSTQTSLWQWDKAVGQLQLQHVISGTDALAISSDGRWVATASPPQAVQLWDTATGQPLRRFEGHSDTVTGLAFSPECARPPEGCSLRMASSANKRGEGSGPGRNSELRIWQVDTGQLLASHDMYPWQTQVKAFITDKTLLTNGGFPDSCGRGGGATSVAVWAIDDLLSAAEKIEPLWRNYGLDGNLSGDGSRLIGLTQNEPCLQPGVAHVWDVTSGAELSQVIPFDEFPAKYNYFEAYALNPSGDTLAIGLRDGRIGLWAADTAQLIHTFDLQPAGVTSLVYSSDGRLLVSGHQNGQINLWDAETYQLRHTLSGHTTDVTQLLFSPDGGLLLSASTDGTVRLWGVKNEDSLQEQFNWKTYSNPEYGYFLKYPDFLSHTVDTYEGIGGTVTIDKWLPADQSYTISVFSYENGVNPALEFNATVTCDQTIQMAGLEVRELVGEEVISQTGTLVHIGPINHTSKNQMIIYSSGSQSADPQSLEVFYQMLATFQIAN